MSQQNNTVNVTDGRAPVIIGAIGIFVGALSCALIWTTRDMWQVQAREMEWMRDRISKLESQVDTERAWRERHQSEIQRLKDRMP